MEIFKYAPKITISDKVLRDKAFSIAKNKKLDGNQRGLATMVYKFFDKNSDANKETQINSNSGSQ